MRILLVNKFLFPKGGAETYVIRLGEHLAKTGNEVEYFGMEDEQRTLSNSAGQYTSYMDFHEGSYLSKLSYPFKTVYSAQARKKLRKVLDDFRPDVVHLNNFTYQLTPSIILEVVKWRRKNGRKCKIVFTAHDYNLVCPNHMLNNPNTKQNCEKCLGGHFINCAKGKCIHSSFAKSVVGTTEGYFWRMKGTYKYIDEVICCSEFLKTKMDSNPIFADKTIALHNFIEKVPAKQTEKKDYALYFGRYSEEKGIATLLEVIKELPDIPFVFAGGGPIEDSLNGIENLKNVGFKTGEELETLIREARFSVYPSEWYENCPFSVMESIMYQTPVVGARIGGIPELIRDKVDGELFESADKEALKKTIRELWDDKDRMKRYSDNCLTNTYAEVGEYCDKLTEIYSR